MAHLIDKDAVMAEIDKIMTEEMDIYKNACKYNNDEVSISPVVFMRMQMLRSYIDNLEVFEI